MTLSRTITGLPLEELRIKITEYKHWDLYLHPYQCYLGRCYLWASRSDAVDLMDISEDEWAEFRTIGRAIKEALNSIFSPEMFNYAALGNVARHLHVHFIPRYAMPRSFQGINFVDRQWGKNYAPYDKNFVIPIEILQDIADEISKKLKEIM